MITDQAPKTASILYVEDEKGIQEQLAEVLQEYCDELYLADDGIQGLLQYRQHAPKIVVSDIKMPVMDGIEMVRQIKAMDKDARVIFTTAFSDYDFLQSAIEMQVDGYILKPIDLERLEEKLTRIIRDIMNEEELEEKERLLVQQSKLAAMGEMISNIAHQWRQPLGAISAMVSAVQVEAALNGSISEDRINECVHDVQEQTSYLSQTIDDFRHFFSPHNDSEPYHLWEFINRCVGLVKASFDNETIELITEIDESIENMGDPNQLTQALINILNNARDALKAVEGLQKKLVFLFSVTTGDHDQAVITIRDNAGGIPEAVIGHIFDPYFTTKFKSQGTGLGLYITHTIITRNLGGSIEAVNDVFEHEGETYKGAKFIIKLPIANPSEET
jgi:signal transduction histidine kinase